MNLKKLIIESLDSNEELNFWIKCFMVFFVIFNIFGLIISKDPWDDFYDIINNILVNILAGFIFYVLVVYIPEKKAKRIKKKNFKIVFEITKRSILEILLRALNSTSETIDTELLEPKHFKTFFTYNKLELIEISLKENQNLRDEIITELEILKLEIFYILTALETSDKQVYDFLKELSIIIHHYKNQNTQKIGIKNLVEFIQKLFTGYNWNKQEYSEEDVIENLLKRI